MQLLLILALLLYGGKGNAGNVLSEVKPVLESLGGEQIQEALKNAEEISSVLEAVRSFGSASPVGEERGTFFADEKRSAQVSFPLAPISAIADKDITYSLSKYISET